MRLADFLEKKEISDMREALRAISDELDRKGKFDDGCDAYFLATEGEDREVKKKYDHYVSLAYDV